MIEFQRVGMIGAGLMGHALALVHALGGCQVRLQDVSAEQLERAPNLIAEALDTLIEAGLVDAGEKATVLARIHPTPDIAEAVADAQLIVEAVVENVDVKRTVYAAIDAAAPADAVLASNTSHLDPFPLIPEARQATAAITHWYTPPYILDLVDVCAGPKADRSIAERLRDFYLAIGKKPVVFDTVLPGYIANRLQAAMSLEIYHLMDEGLVTADMVDDSIKYGLALRMATLGHLKKADFTGIDMIRRAMANGMYEAPEPRPTSPSIEKLVDEGRLGVMAGAGFFDYGGRSPEELFKERDRGLLAMKKLVDEIEKKHPL